MGNLEKIANKLCDLFGVTATNDQSEEYSSSDTKDTEV